MRDLHAELGEGAVDQGELLGVRVLDLHIAAGDGAQGQEGDDLVEVFGKGEVAAAQALHAVDAQARGAQALELGAQHLHELAELLHMRLAGGIHQGGAAVGQGGAEHEVLGGGDRGVVGPVVVGAQLAGHMQGQAVGQALDAGAKALEDLHMGIDLACAQGATP